MKKLTRLSVGFALIVVGCNLFAADRRTTGKSAPTAKLVDIGKRELANMLNDPPSARFKSLHITEWIAGDERTEQALALCGSFNAKNRYGGYGDYELFYVEMSRLGSVSKVWMAAKSDNDFTAIDEEIDAELAKGNIGPLGAIKRKGTARTQRLEKESDFLKLYGDRCVPEQGTAKDIWKQ